MSKAGRLAVVVAMLLGVAAGLTFAVKALTWQPQTVDFSPGPDGAVHVTLETVGSIGFGSHPTWVSYLLEDPQGQWLHTTFFQVPAHTKVDMTIYQFDSGSPLRNQELGRVVGTTGGTAELNGRRFTVLDSNAGNGVGHTFSIPTLGISVPLWGNGPNATLCAVAPCLPSSTAYPHNTETFSFTSPGPGEYPWQCFVPCGLGYLYGNGGPMQTEGYMGGFLKVA